MTEELASRNDKAFIKLAQEMRQIQNGLHLCDAVECFLKSVKANQGQYQDVVKSAAQRMVDFTRKYGAPSKNLPKELVGLGMFTESIIASFSNLEEWRKAAEARLTVIGPLLDAYEAGEDVLLVKLQTIKGDE